MDGYEHLAGMMKALGHPVRLQILEVLRRDEACVCHLETLLGQRQAYISQQLMRLRDAGLVVDRRDGLNVFYSLADPSIGTLLDVARLVDTTRAGKAIIYPAAREAGGACACPKCDPATTLAQAGENWP